MKCIGRLEAALAASQANAKTIDKLGTRLMQLRCQHSATKAGTIRLARQHSRLSRQHACLQKAHRRGERQKAALQQKALQLKQLFGTLIDMGSSMQEVNNSMSHEVQLIRAEFTQIQGQLAALHSQAESPRIKAGSGMEAEVVAGGTSTKGPFKQVWFGALHRW